jgi:hypothetical protein
MKIIPNIFLVLCVATVFEIIGSETGNNIIRPTCIIDNVGSYISSFAQFFATVLVWVSDIFKLIKDLWQFIVEFIEPLYTKVITAFSNIVGKFFSQLIYNPINVFFTTYGEQLSHAYNQFSTVLLSLVWVFGGLFASLIVAEIVGIIRKMDSIRPSKYIMSMASSIYNEFYSLGYYYFVICNMFGFVSKIIKYLNIYFKPYMEKVSEACGYIFTAVKNLLESPLAGLYNGFIFAVYTTKHYTVATVMCVLTIVSSVLIYGFGFTLLEIINLMVSNPFSFLGAIIIGSVALLFLKEDIDTKNMNNNVKSSDSSSDSDSDDSGNNQLGNKVKRIYPSRRVMNGIDTNNIITNNLYI